MHDIMCRTASLEIVLLAAKFYADTHSVSALGKLWMPFMYEHYKIAVCCSFMVNYTESD